MIKAKGLMVVTVMSLFLQATQAQQRFISHKTGFKKDRIIHFIFTSDVHFGLLKDSFRGKKNVPAAAVNAAMVEQMNRLPEMILPGDKAVAAGQKIKCIEGLIITGDIANREEGGIQSAEASWNEFIKVYAQLLNLKTAAGTGTPLLLTPGNHDVSNAIGYRRTLNPATDASSMIGIYNMEMHPVIKRKSGNFNYIKDKIHYSITTGGMHLVFVNLWPDATERSWMEKDLLKIKRGSPVLLFTHSMPDVDARFFINPNGNHSINDSDKFENLLTEKFKDGFRVTDSAITERKQFAKFLKAHPSIKTYFHGHSNYTEFYDWQAPGNTTKLHCFRADSPMKGKYSAKDETKLSFIVISIDTGAKKLTAREYLWNSDPEHPGNLPVWGAVVSVSL
ncbi:MAG: metallophosphoesterase [Bacteroidota bacterium]